MLNNFDQNVFALLFCKLWVLVDNVFLSAVAGTVAELRPAATPTRCYVVAAFRIESVVKK